MERKRIGIFAKPPFPPKKGGAPTDDQEDPKKKGIPPKSAAPDAGKADDAGKPQGAKPPFGKGAAARKPLKPAGKPTGATPTADGSEDTSGAPQQDGSQPDPKAKGKVKAPGAKGKADADPNAPDDGQDPTNPEADPNADPKAEPKLDANGNPLPKEPGKEDPNSGEVTTAPGSMGVAAPVDPRQVLLDRIKAENDKNAMKPDFNEVLFADPRRIFGGQLTVYNPSSLVSRQSMYIYDKMRKDDQIKAALAFKKYAVLSAGWEIVSPKDQPEDWDVTESVRENLEDITDDERTLDDILLEMLTSLDFGFSVSEKVYEDRGVVWLKDIKTRRPHEFTYQQDVHGNIISIFQEAPAGVTVPAPGPMNAAIGMGNGFPVPRHKVVLVTHNREFSNFYGQSDLDAAYRAWVVKDNAYKWLAMFLEKLGIPPIFALYNPQAYIGTPLESLKSVIDRMQAATFGIMPRNKPDDLDFWSPELGGQTSSVFIPALNMLNQDISRAILMPSLLGFTADAQQGSMARSNTHFDVFLMSVNVVRKNLESAMNSQVIRPLVDLNYGPQLKYPEFRFLPTDDDQRVELLKTWKDMVASKVVTPQNSDETTIRKLLKMPERQIGDEMGAGLGIDPLTGLPLDANGQPITGPVGADGQPLQQDEMGNWVDTMGNPVEMDEMGNPLDENGDPIPQPQPQQPGAAASAATLGPDGKPVPTKLDENGKPLPDQAPKPGHPAPAPGTSPDDYEIDGDGDLVDADGNKVLDAAGNTIQPEEIHLDENGNPVDDSQPAPDDGKNPKAEGDGTDAQPKLDENGDPIPPKKGIPPKPGAVPQRPGAVPPKPGVPQRPTVPQRPQPGAQPAVPGKKPPFPPKKKPPFGKDNSDDEEQVKRNELERLEVEVQHFAALEEWGEVRMKAKRILEIVATMRSPYVPRS